MANPHVSPGKQWLLDWATENWKTIGWFLFGFVLGASIF